MLMHGFLQALAPFNAHDLKLNHFAIYISYCEQKEEINKLQERKAQHHKYEPTKDISLFSPNFSHAKRAPLWMYSIMMSKTQCLHIKQPQKCIDI